MDVLHCDEKGSCECSYDSTWPSQQMRQSLSCEMAVSAHETCLEHSEANIGRQFLFNCPNSF
jgi:hypothetical protein